LYQVILSKFQLFVHNYSDIRLHVYSFLFSILIIRVVKKAYTVFRVYYPPSPNNIFKMTITHSLTKHVFSKDAKMFMEVAENEKNNHNLLFVLSKLISGTKQRKLCVQVSIDDNNPCTNFSWKRKTSVLRVLEIYNNLFLTLII